MKVRVQLFASIRQAVGRDWLEVDLPEGATVGHLRCRLAEHLPQVAHVLEQALFAFSAQYADDGQPIHANADVACIPPVSGG